MNTIVTGNSVVAPALKTQSLYITVKSHPRTREKKRNNKNQWAEKHMLQLADLVLLSKPMAISFSLLTDSCEVRLFFFYYYY